MALRAIPARGGWVWAWLTPAWAATARPTISAVAAMLSTAVSHRRTRRVMVTSLVRLHPVVPGSPVVRSRGRGGWVPTRRRQPPAPTRRCRAAAPPGPPPPSAALPHPTQPGPGDHLQRPSPGHLAGDHDTPAAPPTGPGHADEPGSWARRARHRHAATT